MYDDILTIFIVMIILKHIEISSHYIIHLYETNVTY